MKNLSHISSLKAKKDETTIEAIVATILDLEAIYRENFFSELDDELNIFALKKCKTNLSTLLSSLNLFNLNLSSNKLNFSKDNDEFLTINDIPRIQLSFKKRDKELPIENQGEIDLENEHVHNTISLINKLLQEKQPTNILDVRQKYVSNNDGFLFTLNFHKTVSVIGLIKTLRDFQTEISNLTLDELMISQQFTDLFKMQYINPFWLENNHRNLVCDQSILISVRNIESSTPFYYFKQVVEHLISILQLTINKAETTINSDSKPCFFSYNSLNQSYVYCNLIVQLENPDD